MGMTLSIDYPRRLIPSSKLIVNYQLLWEIQDGRQDGHRDGCHENCLKEIFNCQDLTVKLNYKNNTFFWFLARQKCNAWCPVERLLSIIDSSQKSKNEAMKVTEKTRPWDNIFGWENRNLFSKPPEDYKKSKLEKYVIGDVIGVHENPTFRLNYLTACAKSHPTFRFDIYMYILHAMFLPCTQATIATKYSLFWKSDDAVSNWKPSSK